MWFQTREFIKIYQKNHKILIQVNGRILGKRNFSGKLRNCFGVHLNFRCLNNTLGVPYEFNDWEELGYVRSLLHYRVQ